MKHKTERGQAVAEFPLLLLLLGMALFLVLLLLPPGISDGLEDALLEINVENSHAIQKHGSQAVAVRLAHDNCGADYEFYHEEWDRTACIVEFDDENGSRWGIRILDSEEEVTAFIPRAGRTWQQFVEYMQTRGYELIK